MKKLYFTLLSIIAYAVTSAQTITSTNHAPIIGDSYSRIQVDSTTASGLSPIKGASAVWTYTAINTRTTSVVNTFTMGSSASTGSLYPSGSIVKLNGGEKSFYTISASDMKFWGGTVVLISVPADFVLTAGVPQAGYPMSFGDSIGVAAFTGTISSTLGSGSITAGNGYVKYDGKGVLNLPAISATLSPKTFTNVIRLKNVVKFSYNITSMVGPITGSVTFENFDYYATQSSKHPLFTVASSTITSSLSAPSAQSFAYLNKDYLAIGVNEVIHDITNLNIFPNPAKSNFNISLTNENAEVISYEMMNVLGQTVRKENLGNTKGDVKFNIETAGIESGIYFVKVNAGNASSVKKITIQ